MQKKSTNRNIKNLAVTTDRNGMVIRVTAAGQAEDGRFTLGIYTEGLVDVPVETLHSHIRFIQNNNLWGEVADALKEAGITTVPMDIQAIRLITGLVAAKGRQLRREADDPDTVVTPRCGCPADGTGDAGGDAGGDGGPPR
jgi:hypothetical protein